MVRMEPIAMESVLQTVRRADILTGIVLAIRAGWVSIVAQVICAYILVFVIPKFSVIYKSGID